MTLSNYYAPSGKPLSAGVIPTQYYEFSNGNLVVFLSPAAASDLALTNGVNAVITDVIRKEFGADALPPGSVNIQPDDVTQLGSLVKLDKLTSVQGEVDGVAGMYPVFRIDKD